jgi:hypothetical protein
MYITYKKYRKNINGYTKSYWFILQNKKINFKISRDSTVPLKSNNPYSTQNVKKSNQKAADGNYMYVLSCPAGWTISILRRPEKGADWGRKWKRLRREVEAAETGGETGYCISLTSEEVR